MHLFGSSHPTKTAHSLITHKVTKRHTTFFYSFLFFFAVASGLQRKFIATSSPERALLSKARCVSKTRQYAHKLVTKAIQGRNNDYRVTIAIMTMWQRTRWRR